MDLYIDDMTIRKDFAFLPTARVGFGHRDWSTLELPAIHWVYFLEPMLNSEGLKILSGRRESILSG
jgi:hypothetical protein